MQTNKLSEKTLIASASTLSGVAFGAMSSRVIDDKLPIKKAKLRHGALLVIGALGAAMVKPNDNVGKAVQGAFAGMAATQGVNLIKDFVKTEEMEADSVIKTALGSPDSSQQPIVIYDNSYAPPAIDTYYNDREEFLNSPAVQYMSSTDQQFSLV